MCHHDHFNDNGKLRYLLRDWFSHNRGNSRSLCSIHCSIAGSKLSVSDNTEYQVLREKVWDWCLEKREIAPRDVDVIAPRLRLAYQPPKAPSFRLLCPLAILPVKGNITWRQICPTRCLVWSRYSTDTSWYRGFYTANCQTVVRWSKRKPLFFPAFRYVALKGSLEHPGQDSVPLPFDD